jgi:hypothetical protein
LLALCSNIEALRVPWNRSVETLEALPTPGLRALALGFDGPSSQELSRVSVLQFLRYLEVTEKGADLELDGLSPWQLPFLEELVWTGVSNSTGDPQQHPMTFIARCHFAVLRSLSVRYTVLSKTGIRLLLEFLDRHKSVSVLEMMLREDDYHDVLPHIEINTLDLSRNDAFLTPALADCLSTSVQTLMLPVFLNQATLNDDLFPVFARFAGIKTSLRTIELCARKEGEGFTVVEHVDALDFWKHPAQVLEPERATLMDNFSAAADMLWEVKAIRISGETVRSFENYIG